MTVTGVYMYIYIYLGPVTGTCVYVLYCVAACTQCTITQRGGTHSTGTHGIIYIYDVCTLLYSAAWWATSGRWASQRAADGRTPRRAADRWVIKHYHVPANRKVKYPARGSISDEPEATKYKAPRSTNTIDYQR